MGSAWKALQAADFVGGELCCPAATPSALGGMWAVGGGLGCHLGIAPALLSTRRSCRACHRGPAISPSPHYSEGRRALAQADFLCENNRVCISSVHLSGWNTVSWLILKWDITRFPYVNLLVRDGTPCCSNLPMVSVSSFSHLLLFSLALKFHCSGQEWHLCLKAKAYGKDSLGIWCLPDTESSAGGFTGLLRQSDSLVPFA